MTTLAIKAKASRSRVAAINLPYIPWKAVLVVSLTLLFGMVAGYVVLINQLTAGSYTIKNYNRQITQLLEENRTLEANFAQSGFLMGVQEKVHAQNFEKTTTVTYVQLPGNSVGMVK